MPKLHGTGPQGLGPGTGRGRGRCKIQQGLEYGKGMGRGRFCPLMNEQEPVSKQEQLKMLKAYKKRIEADIEALEKELKEDGAPL